YKRGEYLLLIDPLDGSSNIDVNISVGTIFSVLRCPKSADGKYSEPDERAFLQPGSRQVAAGFAVYGPTTVFVLTVGEGVHGFTLDRETYTFVLPHPEIRLPAPPPPPGTPPPRRHAEVRDQRLQCAPRGAAGKALHRRVPCRRRGSARQG